MHIEHSCAPAVSGSLDCRVPSACYLFPEFEFSGMVSLVSQQGCGRRAGGRSNGGKASLPSGLAIALLAACFTGSHAFDVHWNIVGSDAGEVAAQLTPKVRGRTATRTTRALLPWICGATVGHVHVVPL